MLLFVTVGWLNVSSRARNNSFYFRIRNGNNFNFNSDSNFGERTMMELEISQHTDKTDAVEHL